jgi:type II secretory pathway component HofQ
LICRAGHNCKGKGGKAIVIAGLISQIASLTKWVTGLRSIPLLGSLFKHMEEKKENRELVIFITPHIMK